VIQERPQYYVFRFPNPNSVIALQELGVLQSIDPDAPFRCYGVAVVVYNGTSGQGSIALRFSRPDGRFLQKNLAPATALVPFDTGNPLGAAGGVGPNFVYFAPLYPNILYPPKSGITIDIQNLPLNSDTLCLVIFVGTKLFAEGPVVWSPQLPETYRSLPFLSYPVQIPLAQILAGTANNIPFNVDADAGFVWQTGQHTSVNIASSVHVGLKIKDYTGKYYMNDFVPVELLFGFDNAQLPGFPYPDIYIPRKQALYLDAVRLA
jgi:hypothetical protein